MAKGKHHLLIKKLHEMYGPYVRIGKLNTASSLPDVIHPLAGPNEISVLDASFISGVLGADGMPKGPSKSLLIPFSNCCFLCGIVWEGRFSKGEPPSLLAMRIAHEHARRRKRWNRAFNTAAVKGYEPIVQKRALQLVDELEKRSTKNGHHSVCLSEWLTYFT